MCLACEGLKVKDPASQESLKPLNPLLPVSPLLDVDRSLCSEKGEVFHCAPRAHESSPLTSAGASLDRAGVKREGDGRDSLTVNPHCFAAGWVLYIVS